MALAPTQNQKQGPSQEYLLLDYLQRLNRSLEGRMAVHIHLSRLRPQNRQDHHVRIAATTFEGMTQTYDGQVFILSSSDLFFVCKDASIDDIDAAILKVRHLFNEDPLTHGEEEEDMDGGGLDSDLKLLINACINGRDGCPNNYNYSTRIH